MGGLYANWGLIFGRAYFRGVGGGGGLLPELYGMSL